VSKRIIIYIYSNLLSICVFFLGGGLRSFIAVSFPFTLSQRT